MPMPLTLPRLLTIAAAFVGWMALALDGALTVQLMKWSGRSPLQALWWNLAFFTELTNILAAGVLTFWALRPSAFTPRLGLAAAASITLVSLVYAVALSGRWSLSGPQIVADVLVHYVMPTAFVAIWMMRSHGGLGWRDALWCVVFPAAYVVYAFIRGAFDGFYPYWFLDPASTSLPELARNILILLAALLAVGVGFVALDRRLARRRMTAG